jgi:hypothetical protein
MHLRHEAAGSDPNVSILHLQSFSRLGECALQYKGKDFSKPGVIRNIQLLQRVQVPSASEYVLEQIQALEGIIVQDRRADFQQTLEQDLGSLGAILKAGCKINLKDMELLFAGAVPGESALSEAGLEMGIAAFPLKNHLEMIDEMISMPSHVSGILEACAKVGVTKTFLPACKAFLTVAPLISKIVEVSKVKDKYAQALDFQECTENKQKKAVASQTIQTFSKMFAADSEAVATLLDNAKRDCTQLFSHMPSFEAELPILEQDPANPLTWLTKDVVSRSLGHAEAFLKSLSNTVIKNIVDVMRAGMSSVEPLMTEVEQMIKDHVAAWNQDAIAAVVNRKEVYQLVDKHSFLSCLHQTLSRTLIAVKSDQALSKAELGAAACKLGKWKLMCGSVTALCGLLLPTGTDEEKVNKVNFCASAHESLRGQGMLLQIDTHVRDRLAEAKSLEKPA